MLDSMKSPWKENESPTKEGKASDAYAQTLRALLFLEKNAEFGEAFASFYRAEILPAKDANCLEELLQEPIQAVTGPSLLDHVPDNNRAYLDAQALQLADALFLLTNRHWQQSSNIYLRKIDAALTGLCAAEGRYLLSKMRSIFIERFGEEIQQKGESYEPLDQIINRTGKASEYRFARILRGFSPEEFARQLWEKTEGAAHVVGSELQETLAPLTRYQLRELRTEFAALPDIIVAEELHFLLPAKVKELSAEEQEAKNQEETAPAPLEYNIGALDERIRSFCRIEEVRLLLRGKSKEDIHRICFQHDRLFGDEHGTFAERTDLLPLDSEKKIIASLLQGFSAQAIADELLSALGNHFWWQAEEEHGALLEEALPLFVHGFLPIRKSYQSIFPKRTLVVESQKGEAAVLDARLKISSICAGLREAEQEAVLAVLPDELAHLLRTHLPSRRSLAERFHDFLDSFSTGYCFHQILGPLFNFSTEELSLIQRAYFQLFGVELDDAIRILFEETFQESPGSFTLAMISRRCQGYYTLSSHPDILAIAKKYQDQKPIHQQASALDRVRKSAGDIIGLLLNPAFRDREVAQKIGAQFLTLSLEEQILLDDGVAYFHPEKKRLSELFSKEQFDILLAYREGHAVHTYEDKLETSGVDCISDHCFSSRRLLSCLDEFSREQHKLSLVEQIEKNSSRSAYTFFAAYTEQAYRFARSLASLLKNEKGAKRDLQAQLHALDKPFLQAAAFEQAFDYRFGRLRAVMKYLASKKRIPAPLLARTFLYLEGIDPNLLDKLHFMVEGSDTDSLQSLFRQLADENRSLEEAYDVEFAEAPLRYSIDQCEAPLPACCKTILLLMGYDPDALAEEVEEVIESTAGNVCAERVRRLLSPGQRASVNTKIPTDENWILEMYTQIRTSFQILTGEALLTVIARKQVSKQKFRELTELLFGEQACEGAAELLAITFGSETGEEVAKSLIEFLGKKNPRLRECMVDLYDSYYPSIGMGDTLLHTLKNLEISSTTRTKAELILSAR